MTSIPTSVSSASAIGGMTITMFPTAAAWMLIWLISAPVWRWSWKVSESRCTWSKRSLRRSSTMFCSIFAPR